MNVENKKKHPCNFFISITISIMRGEGTSSLYYLVKISDLIALLNSSSHLIWSYKYCPPKISKAF